MKKILICFCVLFWCLHVSAREVSICNITPQVRISVLNIISQEGKVTCDSVSTQQLASIRHLDLSNSGITSLQPGDFSMLVNLESLNLSNNQLRVLPRGFVFTLPPSIKNTNIRDNLLSEEEKERWHEDWVNRCTLLNIRCNIYRYDWRTTEN